MNRLTSILVFLACSLSSVSIFGSSVFEQFKVSLASASVYDHTESSLQLESESPTYQIKLEQNTDGGVVFSLGRHAYRSNIIVRDLIFGVKIEAFRDGHRVDPTFNLDDSHKNLSIDGNVIIFQTIRNPIPVYFRTTVDSIKLEFSNSHGIDVHQFFTIEDLKVVESGDIQLNPLLSDCDKHSIMFGIEGSSSMDKSERKTVAKLLQTFFKHPPSTLDSNAICIMEFGKNVQSVSESIEKKLIVKNIKSYKKGKKAPKGNNGYVNWEAAFDRAIERQPDVFIFITNRWSNYTDDGPTSFNAQYQSLIAKSNILKSNGTRLLFITSGLNAEGQANTSLYSMLSHNETAELIGADVTGREDLKNVDLISLTEFQGFEWIDFSSLLQCDPTEEVALGSSMKPE